MAGCQPEAARPPRAGPKISWHREPVKPGTGWGRHHQGTDGRRMGSLAEVTLPRRPLWWGATPTRTCRLYGVMTAMSAARTPASTSAWTCRLTRRTSPGGTDGPSARGARSTDAHHWSWFSKPFSSCDDRRLSYSACGGLLGGDAGSRMRGPGPPADGASSFRGGAAVPPAHLAALREAPHCLGPLCIDPGPPAHQAHSWCSTSRGTWLRAPAPALLRLCSDAGC